MERERREPLPRTRRMPRNGLFDDDESWPPWTKWRSMLSRRKLCIRLDWQFGDVLEIRKGVCEAVEIKRNYLSKNFNFDSGQKSYSTVVSTLIADRLSARYYKRNWNSAVLLYYKLSYQWTVQRIYRRSLKREELDYTEDDVHLQLDNWNNVRDH